MFCYRKYLRSLCECITQASIHTPIMKHSHIAVREAPSSPKPGRNSACPPLNAHEVLRMAIISLPQIAALALRAAWRLLFFLLSWEAWISKDYERMGRWWSAASHNSQQIWPALSKGKEKADFYRGNKSHPTSLHPQVYISEVARPSNSLQISLKYSQVQDWMYKIPLLCASFKRS